MLSRDKHSSLLRTYIKYGRKKFYNNGLINVHNKLECLSLANFSSLECKAEALFEWSTIQVLRFKVGSWPFPKTLDWLEILKRDKHSSLLQIKYKKFNNIGPTTCEETFKKNVFLPKFAGKES